jgi:uncharacterized protein
VRAHKAIAILVACSGCAAMPSGNELKDNRMARLDYVELPAVEIAATRRFYEQAFQWNLSEFAPTYAATTTGDTDVGLDADSANRPAAPLPVIQVQDLEATLATVEKAGGTIVKPIFSFPGGRRFHFRDPSGNEMAAWQKAE